MVRGADFSKQIPAKFEARVKGKGKIDVYVNNLKGTVLVSVICDEKEWTTLSKKIERKIDKGVGNIYFVFNGEDFCLMNGNSFINSGIDEVKTGVMGG